jgi:hypothetical protein
MGRKSRRNRSVRHEPKAPRQPPIARAVLDALLQDAKIERMTQAEIMQELVRKHHGDVPVPAIWNHIADRRTQAAATTRGISGGAA